MDNEERVESYRNGESARMAAEDHLENVRDVSDDLKGLAAACAIAEAVLAVREELRLIRFELERSA